MKIDMSGGATVPACLPFFRNGMKRSRTHSIQCIRIACVYQEDR
jgi:hypothetical protein